MMINTFNLAVQTFQINLSACLSSLDLACFLDKSLWILRRITTTQLTNELLEIT